MPGLMPLWRLRSLALLSTAQFCTPNSLFSTLLEAAAMEALSQAAAGYHSGLERDSLRTTSPAQTATTSRTTTAIKSRLIHFIDSTHKKETWGHGRLTGSDA